MSKKSRIKTHVSVRNNATSSDVLIPVGGRESSNGRYWRWGDDNSFPYALASLSRRSVTHRRVINDKADYISGKGFICDEKDIRLTELVNYANGNKETLHDVFRKISFDYEMFGNAFLEVVTDRTTSFVSFFHQDATKCRLAYDRRHVMLHHDWRAFTENEAKTIALFPLFEERPDGTMRSIIHYKDYEPMFENYGVPSYIAGFGVSTIAYKTDRWNISRLDNSYQLSGVMMLTASCDSEEEAREICKTAEKKFAGNPGQVMFFVKDSDGQDNSKFIPIQSNNEGDWKDLHDQATSDIVVAHSWFQTLSGLNYATGFNSERILNEYEVAMNTVILPAQEKLLNPIKQLLCSVFRIDASSLQIVNKPPVTIKQPYMFIWEARKADGIDYDPEDPAQKMYLADISSKKQANE